MSGFAVQSRDAAGLLVPCEIRWISAEKGHGIFAKDFIPKGTLLWRYSNESVREFTAAEFGSYFAGLPTRCAKVNLLRTAYGWGGKMILLLDDSIFWNHSRNQNCITGGGESGNDTHALRDILPGDELLDNYLHYEFYDWLLELYIEYGVDKSFM